MRNNKGFTLVEILGVITLLALLGIIALESIESVNKGNKEKAANAQRESILTAAVAYVPTSSIKLPNAVTGTSDCKTYTYPSSSNSGSTICEVKIYLSYLVEEGLLEEKIQNPLNGKLLNLDTSYVSIIYLTTVTSVDSTRRDEGKFDGNYFYEVHYAY